MHAAVRSGALVGGAVGVALIALVGTLRFEASAEGANSPAPMNQPWIVQIPTEPHVSFRPWREVIGEPSLSSCERSDVPDRSSSTTCSRMLGALSLIDHSHGSSGGTFRWLMLGHPTRSVGQCELSSIGHQRLGSHSPPFSWSRSGDLLYAHDPRRDLHGYRCVASTERGPVTEWTLWIYAPDAERLRGLSDVWSASRPLVPYARLAAALLLVCATIIMARQVRRDRLDALPWREAKRGADGVLRLGEDVVQTPTADAAVTKADAVCVVVADEQDSGIYRTAATVTAVRVRVGSHDVHQRAGRWARRRSAVVAVALAAASVAASAWLIVLSLRR